MSYNSIYKGSVVDATLTAVISGKAGIQGVKVNDVEITPDQETNKVNIEIPELLGSTGQSTTSGMTQKAITDELSGKAKVTGHTYTLLASNWTGSTAPYKQQVPASALPTVLAPLAIVDVVSTNQEQIDAWLCVSKVESKLFGTGDWGWEFTCYSEKPTIDIQINLFEIK